jgi:hypothetical protein
MPSEIAETLAGDDRATTLDDLHRAGGGRHPGV